MAEDHLTSPPGDEEPKNVSEFLMQVDTAWNVYDKESENALMIRADAALFSSYVVAQANLLIDMPSKLAKLRESGIDVPGEIDSYAHYLSSKAQFGLENIQRGIGTSFLIQHLLSHPGDEADSPSSLELLARRYEPAPNGE